MLLFGVVVKFKCEYNGKNFHGFQKQGTKCTVQLVLEEALSKYLNTKVKICASGRTDAGVHARAQVCSFEFMGEIDLFRLNGALNAFLPLDVSVRDFESMPDNFHAQFSAKVKTYLYRVYIARHRSPLREDYYTQIYQQPDVELMRRCASELTGRHNFKSFTPETQDSYRFEREILSFTIEQREDELWFWVTGRGFMRNMVRIMVGTVLDIGSGKKDSSIIGKLLSMPDRALAGQTAPAKGLILYSVEY